MKQKTEELALTVKRIGNATMMLQYDHTHLKRSAEYLKQLGVGYAHVVPPAPTILFRHFEAKAKEIRQAWEAAKVP